MLLILASREMNLFPRNESVTLECPKGYKCVVVSERISVVPVTGSSISGSVTLQKRIDDVVGFRLLFASFSKTGGPIGLASGTLLAVQSKKLGSALSSNPFELALSTNTGNSTSIAYSDIVGIFCGGITNEERSYMFSETNKKHHFVHSMPIQNFDWTVSVVNGSFSGLTSAFVLELIIEFYVLCHCEK